MADQKKPKPVSTLSPQESLAAKAAAKSAKFKELASKRMGATLKQLSGVKNLSNRNSYSYDSVQVTKILNALKAAVNEIEAAFTAPATASTKTTFEL